MTTSQLRQAHIAPEPQDADAALEQALEALLAHQREDGHWLYELEADATISAEYVLLVHYLGETPDSLLEARIARYLRRIQNEDGSWPLFAHGKADVSASVKAYFALKMIGDPVDAEHMVRARKSILAQGGAEASNVFTRTLLALFGVMPWKTVPMMPVELMLLPIWFPIHVSKVSYWSRTVLVPLLVLNSLRPQARNPRGVGIDELFGRPRGLMRLPRKAPHQQASWFYFFSGVDFMLRVCEPLIPNALRKRAVARAEEFVRERLNGESGLGAIFPAMVNAVLMLDVLGVPRDDPAMLSARKSIDHLLVVRDDEAYCQPCHSPVWDTALACHALLEVGGTRATSAAARGLAWLRPLQVLDLYGDWAVRRPQLRPGGWAFQYANAHYPDVDDTAVVVMALHRAAETLDGKLRVAGEAIPVDEGLARAVEWVEGMQSSNGGWGAFEPDSTHFHLNHIPFADHGALLDPPTVDVSARCLSMLAQLEGGVKGAKAQAALDYILAEQEANGSWFGRWGTNYIYGTWSALCGLNAAGLPAQAPAMRSAAAWLISIQNEDGGWGESGDSYRLDYSGHMAAPSTPSQTAWALLGLMAAGETGHEAVARGIDYLIRTQQADGNWEEEYFTAVGFPRVFYLKYHGYSRYFPLWALARYCNLRQDASDVTAWGM
ncbi:squalene--hopene cyclase [Undibacterium terreum]|uniref:Squalene-hopene cyclase n=1 Tax=Undibacterium terreum TaxID=1224302 RepID=A0A916V0I2_9BURK|nr:squalene--hopene cyclase [Undibacterium terreum]GGC99194.1 squalene-hopene cyclase [Undibacterium terreum]